MEEAKESYKPVTKPVPQPRKLNPGWALDPTTKQELKRRQDVQQRRGLDEDSWSDGTNSWTSEHDQWAKESQDPVIALTGVDEAIGYSSDKRYSEVGKHKIYTIYVGKKKFNDAVGFIAVAVNPRTNKGPKANGATQQEAVEKLKSEIDKEIDIAQKISGAATIDFNVDFKRDILELSDLPFYAKIIPGPRLVIAGKEMEQYPEIMKDEGFKKSSLRSDKGNKLPMISLTASSAKAINIIANGRYILGNETIDRDGNRIFDLDFDSQVAGKGDMAFLRTPGFTVGTAREQKEDAQIGADSTSPVGGNIAEDRLAVGDPIIVTAPNAYEGKTGEIAEFSPSGRFVIVRLYNHGEHSMHLSDVEYNQYADDEDADEYGEYEDEQGVAEGDPNAPYTPSPAKPFRNPKGFNKQGTGVGNKLADLNRKEWEEKKKKEQGVAEADETSWTANSAQFRKEEDMSWPVEITLEPNADINQGRGRQVKTMTVTGQSRDAAKKKLVDYFLKNGWTVTGIKFTGDLGGQGVAEGSGDLKSELAAVYSELAPKIERHRDSFGAGQLYDALEAVADKHGAGKQLAIMMRSARNSAHMEYDTNPGGFENWFWFLPFATDDEQGVAEAKATGQRVKVIKGDYSGKTGTIAEVLTNPFRHYGKMYKINLDDGTSVTLSNDALRSIKDIKEQGVAEVKQRLDAKCWAGKHKEGTKIKGGVRVNNCVPNESVTESYWTRLQNERNKKLNSLVNELSESVKKIK